MNWRSYFLWSTVAVAVLGLVALSAVLPDLGSAVNSVGTLVAGIAAAIAAFQSRAAARESRQALALHYEPKVEIGRAQMKGGQTAELGDPAWIFVEVAEQPPVRDVKVRWTDADGHHHEQAVSVDLTFVKLTGCHCIKGTEGSFTLVCDARRLEVTCVEKTTGGRWAAALISSADGMRLTGNHRLEMEFGA